MAEDESVREIFHQSLSTVGLSDIKMFRREGSTLSVASLPATILTPKPFKSKVTPSGGGLKGLVTPSKIPQWKGSTEKLNVKGHIRKWESSASLEVSTSFESF